MLYKCITVMLRLYQSDEEIPILKFPSFEHVTQSGLNIWRMPALKYTV